MSYSSRLCRLMCGGACPTEHDPSHSGLRPVFWGVAPTHFVARRKVRDLPHIRRRSRTHGINPNSFPNCTAWVRRRALSLSNRRLEWVLTVFSLTKSFSAISRLLRPLAISSRISSSRRVIPSSQSRLVQSKELRRRDLPNDDRFLVLS